MVQTRVTILTFDRAAGVLCGAPYAGLTHPFPRDERVDSGTAGAGGNSAGVAGGAVGVVSPPPRSQ